jgi:maleate isomerase
MLAGLPDVSAHFSRLPVTRIDLSPSGLAQFNVRPVVEASKLLADALVDVVCWNGTSSGWLGFGTDRRLAEAVTAETGIPFVTSVLALNEAMEKAGASSFGLVTPYTSDVQEKIVENYARAGIECKAERHIGISRNFDFATVPSADLERLVGEVAESRPAAITTFCTNLKAAHLAERLEAELDIPLYDSVSTGVWKSLSVAGVDPARVAGWGSLFRL